jgi:hypothetical protein
LERSAASSWQRVFASSKAVTLCAKIKNILLFSEYLNTLAHPIEATALHEAASTKNSGPETG